MAAIARFSLVALDCPDPVALAEFYGRLTGWTLRPVEQDWWVELAAPSGPTLAFQRVDGHRRPTWPDGGLPQQAHLDFDVDDLDAAEAEVLELGARKAGHQPKPMFWRTFLDPAGHPFCLVLDESLRAELPG